MQVFLQATLDDASRLIPHAQFYPNQGLDSFLDCLRQAIAARGLPTRLYMDNAKIYRSPQLARIAASIGILIIHTPPYQPEGRGKIERFFRSVREQFLAALDPQALLSIEQLNERLWHWLDTVYHRREHSALQTTPLLRYPMRAGPATIMVENPKLGRRTVPVRIRPGQDTPVIIDLRNGNK